MSERTPTVSETRQAEPFVDDAVQAALRAGRLLARSFGEGRPVTREKTSVRDMVTESDLESEREILSFLEERHPEHGWRSEESGTSTRRSAFEWVVDPLDGTANFARGIPHFSISIALLHELSLRTGVVHDPIRDETFAAAARAGGHLGTRRLEVSSIDRLDHAMISTGFPGAPAHHRAQAAQLAARIIPRVQTIRRTGSAALDLAYVAAGRTEAHLQFALNLHDVAAGILLVTEAGGRVDELVLGDWRGGYLASNGTALHDELLELVRLQLGPVEATPFSLARDR